MTKFGLLNSLEQASLALQFFAASAVIGQSSLTGSFVSKTRLQSRPISSLRQLHIGVLLLLQFFVLFPKRYERTRICNENMLFKKAQLNLIVVMIL